MGRLIDESNAIEEEYADDEIIIVEPDENRVDYTFNELLLGIVIFGLVCTIVILLVPSNRLYNLIGFWMGILISLFMLIHINKTVICATELEPEGARSYIVKHYIIRTLVILVLLTVVLVSGKGNIILTVLGIIGLKVAVYLQPITDKVFLKIKKGG